MATASLQHEPDTKERLLDAAERLFARAGIAATSMPAVTAEAGANVAAVHYHFGSKGELLRAVFERRLAPVNADRLRLLDALEAEAAVVPVEALLDALVRPALEFASRHPSLSELVGLLQAEPADEIRSLFEEVFGETIERFMAALQRSLPEFDEDLLHARYAFAIGAMLSVITHRGPFELEPGEAIPDLVRFLSAGMKAPAASVTDS
ncbi:MAG: TetR/AcrR family transcriptional regulator, partial [Myxococcota bacterium]